MRWAEELTTALSSSSWFKRSISRMLFMAVSDGWWTGWLVDYAAIRDARSRVRRVT